MRRARSKAAYTYYLSLLPHVRRVQFAIGARKGLPLPNVHNGVVIVAEMRSGSSWFGQRVFGARSDVLYLYEPCRANVRVGDAGTWFDDDCIWLVRQLLNCSLPYSLFSILKRDKWSVKMSTPGAFRNYRVFANMCIERHVVIKTVRIFDPAPLASVQTFVVHLERDAAESHCFAPGEKNRVTRGARGTGAQKARGQYDRPPRRRHALHRGRSTEATRASAVLKYAGVGVPPTTG